MAPRNQPTANPSLRNRNRVTNKTRLKVIKENIDADPIVLDEDEERARVVSTAGVDAEDANVSIGFFNDLFLCRRVVVDEKLALLTTETWRGLIG